MGNKKYYQTRTLFVEFICNKLRWYLKFEDNEIFFINNDSTLIFL